MKIDAFSHSSVLLQESICGLNIKNDGIYVDGTAGGAGHSVEIAKKLTSGKLFAFDRDPDAVEVCKERLSQYPAEVINDNFCEMERCLKQRGVDELDGVFATMTFFFVLFSSFFSLLNSFSSGVIYILH